MSYRLSEFKKGEWIVTADGKIAQITQGVDEYGCVSYSNGYSVTTSNGDTEVYPLTLHTKVLAESISDYYDKFNEKGILFPKTGRQLEEFGYRLLELPEEAEAKMFRKIYAEIDGYMETLESHIKYFRD